VWFETRPDGYAGRRMGTRGRKGANRRAVAASRRSRLRPSWLRWKQAADFADEQDRRREAEQRRFAQERVRLELESLYALPPWTASPSA
jgi:hypothetical protein